MSAVVLSAAELCSVNNNSKSHTVSETSIEIENFNEKNAKISSKQVEEINDDKNNLNVASNRQRSSTNSVDSNNVSIVTLDENEENSSVIDSDTDDDEVINNIDSEYKSPYGNVVSKAVNSSNLSQSSILCSNNDSKPNIGSIAVQNSSDITFGNKTFYQGPVTIIYKSLGDDKNKWKETQKSEHDNLGYVHSTTDSNLDRKEKGNSPAIMPFMHAFNIFLLAEDKVSWVFVTVFAYAVKFRDRFYLGLLRLNYKRISFRVVYFVHDLAVHLTALVNVVDGVMTMLNHY